MKALHMEAAAYSVINPVSILLSMNELGWSALLLEPGMDATVLQGHT